MALNEICIFMCLAFSTHKLGWTKELVIVVQLVALKVNPPVLPLTPSSVHFKLQKQSVNADAG